MTTVLLSLWINTFYGIYISAIFELVCIGRICWLLVVGGCHASTGKLGVVALKKENR